MTNLINSLETSWYISPPWGKEVPPILAPLLEKVYIPNPTKIAGYCCGVEWSDECWCYSIASEQGIISVGESELIVTGVILPLRIQTPQFKIGELVKFRFAEGSKIRTVLGLQLINESCFYKIEWHSPALTTDEGACAFPKVDDGLKSGDHFAWVTAFDLVAGI